MSDELHERLAHELDRNTEAMLKLSTQYATLEQKLIHTVHRLDKVEGIADDNRVGRLYIVAGVAIILTLLGAVAQIISVADGWRAEAPVVPDTASAEADAVGAPFYIGRQ